MLTIPRSFFPPMCLLILIGCGGGVGRNRPSVDAASFYSESTVPDSLPVAVVTDRVISGRILGKIMRKPAGLAIDRAGGVYIVDAGNHRIIRLDRELNALSEIGGPGRDPGEFDRPGFVTLDNNLNMFIADDGNQRIDRYDAKLNYVNSVRFVDDVDPLRFGEPSGVAVTDYGELWLADRTNDRLAVFDNAGRLNRFVGDFGYAGGQLDSPEKIVRDSEGNFLVCDGGNGRIVVYDDFANFSHVITSEAFVYPVSLAVTKEGYWLIDSKTGLLFFMLKDGTVKHTIGPTLSGSPQPLRGPSDIAVLPDGRLMISDSGNDRVLVLSVIKGQ